MNISNAYFDHMSRVGFINQRMTRQEFLKPVLFNFLACMSLDYVLTGMGFTYVVDFVAIGLTLCMLGAVLQRLNDVGMSRWFAAIIFLPFVGLLFLGYYLLKPSAPGNNQFGPCRA